MNAMNIDAAHFFAFSTGAIIAIDFALAFPERVKKLVLISPGGMTEYFPAAIRNITTPVLSDLSFISLNRKKIRNCLTTAYFDKTHITDEMIDHYYSYLADKGSLDALFTTLNNWDDAEISENIGSLKANVYIFWGECDQWHPLEYLETFEDVIPNVYAATVRNGGHMIHEEKSRELNRKAIELLLTDEVT
jgi:pimeloyl-ACP methyl ester carboxylesterase